MSIEKMLAALAQGAAGQASGDRMRNALGNILRGAAEQNGTSGTPGLEDLFGSLMRGGQGGAAANALSPGDLTNILGSLLGGKNAGAGGAMKGGLGDLLGGVLGSLGNNKIAAGGLGALIGSLLGGKNAGAGGAMKGGLLALLGMTALQALARGGMGLSGGKKASLVGLMEPETPEQQQELDERSELILRAMFNAIKADGQIDSSELHKILERLHEAGADDEESRQYIVNELQKPMETEALVAAAQGDSQLAAELYSASLMAITADTPAERDYLDQLAANMGLTPEVVRQIEQIVGMN